MKVNGTETSTPDRIIKKVYLLSLGCSKNLVDSESMSMILSNEGFVNISEPSDADVIIVNTCGFIESAKQEAIDMILEMADHKISQNNTGISNKQGKCEFLIVTGCLAQRYSDEIAESMPEVDAVLGTYEYGSIASTINELYKRKQSSIDPKLQFCGPVVRVGKGDPLKHLSSDRIPSTKGYAYLKIAEGCSNNCAYCAIPGIRGQMVSRSMEDITVEAQSLARRGFYELVLIAQDTTRYGQDLYGRRMLSELIRRISVFEGIKKIRLLYCYSDGITDELIKEIAENPKVAKYIDIPIQHISDDILRKMNRHDTAASIEKCIVSLRNAIPGITLRTTVMTGFPGETDKDFMELYDFVSRIRFDLLGCFVFSPEEGTAAFDLKPEVPRAVAERRYERIMKLQKKISLEKNKAKMNMLYKVTIDSPAPDGVFYLGRGDAQAPEIDPQVYVIASDDILENGMECTVRIVDYSEYELTGVTS